MVKLSAEEILFFKQNGYLIKHQVLDSDLMAKARDRMWDYAPSRLKPDNPKSWIGPYRPEEEFGNDIRKGFSWKIREPGKEAWMVRMLATDASIWGMAEQLLGRDTLQIPDRIRGIYCVLPEGDSPERPTTCHVDGHPFHLGIVGYIDNVAPGGGGFTVWPSSHRTFYYDFHSQYIKEPKPSHERNVIHFNKQVHVECHGGPGDIVFWHHRIGHSVGHNRSKQIRKAVLYDFKKKNLDKMLEEPPCENMWRDWSKEIRNAGE